MAAAVEGARRKERILCLFDVDGTLTPARQKIDPEVSAFLQKLRSRLHPGGEDRVLGAGQEREDPGEVRGSLEDRVCWQGAKVLPRRYDKLRCLP
ncbi:phosphomannomutase 1, isoform CRA_d [Rattus norvegicus]|uniref:Phosphomannomutase 1, isoform CRA_d n=1 Tax=Rattus norvegicus TaxID=10116 RepID=A6HT38_RAT|nr:phosphomannomutase 1, isoform CRA_d [Rattus norvegicus]